MNNRPQSAESLVALAGELRQSLCDALFTAHQLSAYVVEDPAPLLTQAEMHLIGLELTPERLLDLLPRLGIGFRSLAGLICVWLCDSLGQEAKGR